MAKGTVYLVGGGPGDPGLITLRGLRLIRKADVIVHDHLIPHELLGFAQPNAEIISVAKFASRYTVPQDRINSLIVEKAKENKTVVRLKGGDPFLFGRGGEEAEACVKAKVNFEVVPGVTSALAGPAYAGIAPTHRDYASSLAIVTGHRSDDKPIEIPKADTLIFLMPVANLTKIIDSLLESGLRGSTPIAAIQNGTCYNQKIISATLDTFVETARREELEPPAIFVVGKVAQLHEKLEWFSKKMNVLVLGKHPEKYEYLGNIVHRPIIDCAPIDDYSDVDSLLMKDLAAFDWIVFTSPNGVYYFFDRLYITGSDARALAGIKTAAIGNTTAEKVKEFGVICDLTAQDESSRGLLEVLRQYDMKDKKVLLPRSDIATEELPQGLMQMNACIEKLTVYKTVDIEPGPVDFDYIDCVLFTSGSTVRAFVKYFGSLPAGVKAFATGHVTQAEAQSYNITAELIEKIV
ncbi:MAG: uroporphyrinogen-III C-methyltransferase [Planctomycetota bacterium]